MFYTDLTAVPEKLYELATKFNRCDYKRAKFALILLALLKKWYHFVGYLKFDCVAEKPDPNMFPRCYTYVHFNYEFCPDPFDPIAPDIDPYECRYVEEVGEPVDADYYDLYEIVFDKYVLHVPVPLTREYGVEKLFSDAVSYTKRREPRMYTHTCEPEEEHEARELAYDPRLYYSVVSSLSYEYNRLPLVIDILERPAIVLAHSHYYFDGDFWREVIYYISSLLFVYEKWRDYEILFRVLVEEPSFRYRFREVVFDLARERRVVVRDRFGETGMRVRRLEDNDVIDVVAWWRWGETEHYTLPIETAKRLALATRYMRTRAI